MTRIDELTKAVAEAAEAGCGLLKKSQMAFDFSLQPKIDDHTKRAEYHRGMEKRDTSAGNYTSADHHAKQALHHENMASSLSNTAANPHHKAYTRTSQSGTVSNIQAKGSPTPQAETVTHNDLKKHPLYTESDHEYLKGKGYEPAEIKAIWDRDHKQGNDPLVHKQVPNVTGVIADPDFYKKTVKERVDAALKNDTEYQRKKLALTMAENALDNETNTQLKFLKKTHYDSKARAVSAHRRKVRERIEKEQSGLESAGAVHPLSEAARKLTTDAETIGTSAAHARASDAHRAAAEHTTGDTQTEHYHMAANHEDAAEEASKDERDAAAAEHPRHEHDFSEGDDVQAEEAYGGKRGRISEWHAQFPTVTHTDGTKGTYHHSNLRHHDGWDEDND